ncbi:MAG: CASTOR/POLLUX-related putative ion channel [Bacteroidota bacterium]|jgi:Trk K+ transport system NAD-binding subunit
MTKASFKEKLRYNFDNTLSKGPIAIISWLALVTFLLVILAGIILFLTGLSANPAQNEPFDLTEGMWQSLMRVLDAGTVTGDEGWAFRLFMLLITIAGLFIFSSLIGSISSGIDESISNLRKGKSKVIETNHTLILGYSSMIYSVISELCLANESQKKAIIVILADLDKVEMEDDIRAKIEDTKTSKIIVRSGNPLDLRDLQMVNYNEAKSIILLSPENEDNPDNHVIKSVLSITGNKNRKKGPYHIVAEIKDNKNKQVANLVGGKEVSYVFSTDLISRLTAQTCRQSGLSIIYSDLLQFDGDEIYFYSDRGLIGLTFKQCLYSFEDSCVMGVFTGDRKVLLNPDMHYTINKEDQLILIAQDDSKINRLLIPKEILPVNFIPPSKKEKELETTLILGWNDKGKKIIEELDHYVVKGSSVSILGEIDDIKDSLTLLSEELQNITLYFQHGNINDRNTLDELRIDSFNHIIVLSYMNKGSIQISDAITLICLIHLRDISEKVGKDFSVVSEMLDVQNRELAEVAKADDFIVSDNLLSLLMTQIAENKDLEMVYENLFSDEGAEIYLNPVEEYLDLSKPVDFYQVIESASNQGHTAIGFRSIQPEIVNNGKFGIVLNPLKSNQIKFEQGDFLIVLAEA